MLLCSKTAFTTSLFTEPTDCNKIYSTGNISSANLGQGLSYWQRQLSVCVDSDDRDPPDTRWCPALRVAHTHRDTSVHCVTEHAYCTDTQTNWKLPALTPYIRICWPGSSLGWQVLSHSMQQSANSSAFSLPWISPEMALFLALRNDKIPTAQCKLLITFVFLHRSLIITRVATSSL